MNEEKGKILKFLKKNFVIILVLIIILILVLFRNYAYAWFKATITGNENAKNMVVETGTLSVVYTDGPAINTTELEPGWTYTKTFSIKNEGTVSASYKLYWEEMVNEFTRKTDLVYSVSSTNGGGNLIESTIPSDNSEIIEATITPGTTQTYTMIFKYLALNEDQNTDQFKNINGKIGVKSGSS